MNRLSSHSSCHKYSLTASEALSHGLNLQNFPGRACPQTPLQDCACSIYVASFLSDILQVREGRGMRLARSRTTASYVCRTNLHPICTPPSLLQSLDPPPEMVGAPLWVTVYCWLLQLAVEALVILGWAMLLPSCTNGQKKSSFHFVGTLFLAC